MGKRGPKAETKGHLKLRGSPLAKNRPEPVVVSGCPVRPKWLKAKAKKKFEALVEQYTDLPYVVGAIDSELLARYCDTWAWWLKLKGEIKKEGEVITSFNKSGDSYFAANPKVTIHLKLAALLDKMEKEKVVKTVWPCGQKR